LFFLFSEKKITKKLIKRMKTKKALKKPKTLIKVLKNKVINHLYQRVIKKINKKSWIL